MSDDADEIYRPELPTRHRARERALRAIREARAQLESGLPPQTPARAHDKQDDEDDEEPVGS